MKIITINTVKGGVGKTTLTYQFGEYLASLGKKVLMIDFDFQRNLTELYLQKADIKTDEESAKNILLSQSVKIHHVKDNIDLVAGSANFDDVKTALADDMSRNMRLFFWLSDMQDEGKLDYDYILIDTRPEFDFIVGNAVIASQAIISPITPDDFGINSRFDELALLENFKDQNVDMKTRQTLVTAKLMLIANKVKPNTKLSRKLNAEITKGNIKVIEKIPDREIFNRSANLRKSLVEMRKEKQWQPYFDFIDELNKKWENIKEQIDNLE